MSDRSQKSLEGRWQMVRAIYQGVAAPEEISARTVLELFAASYAVTFDGATTDQGTLEYNESDTMESIRLVGTVGPNAGRTILCLFQQVGERLRICFGLDGILPRDFTAPKDENRYLATYRKISSA